MLERNALYQLTRARVVGFLREPEAVFWVFVFPILLAAALGIAFRTQAPQPVAVGVYGHDPPLVRALEASDELRVATFADSTGARRALRTGRMALVVRGRTAAAGPALIYDPTRPESRLARLLVDDAVQRAAGRRDMATLQRLEVRERGSRYIDFLIPGLLGMNLLGTGMWGVGFPIATSRQQKLLKRMMATPMRRVDYLLAFLLARIVWLVLEVAALMVFARLAFGITIGGSWAAFAGVALVGAFAFSALGLLTASRARTIEAVSGLMNAVMLPMWLLSGTFFSAARFPGWLQPVVRALPLTAVNDALRAIVNEGAGWAAVRGELALLVAWALVCFGVALRIFRWE
jgi:ABC-2 type transport system permease protein